jgi:hypothetical protein
MKYIIAFMLAGCTVQPTQNSVPRCYAINADKTISIFHCPQPLKNDKV